MNFTKKIPPIGWLSLGIGLAVSGYAQSDLTKDWMAWNQSLGGLVSWWPAESNANDEVDGNHGTLINTSGFSTGKVGQAFNFNGVNQYVEIPNSSSLNPSGSFTIEGWIFPKQDRLQAIMAKWTHSPTQPNQRSYSFLMFSGGSLVFSISDVAHQWDLPFHSFFSPTNVIAINTWNHVAAVYDQLTGARRMYVNGSQVAERTDSPITIYNGTAKASIGAQLEEGPAKYFFDGLIDELRFYSSALSSTEVKDRYAAGNPVLHAATATAQVINGFVVGVTIIDPGYGYTNAPVVEIVGGGGQGAQAIAQVANGIVTGITVTDAGIGYNHTPEVLIASPPFAPWLEIAVSQVRVTQHVVRGHKYVLESSGAVNASDWTPVGEPFTAQSEVVDQVFEVNSTGRYFRIREIP